MPERELAVASDGTVAGYAEAALTDGQAALAGGRATLAGGRAAPAGGRAALAGKAAAHADVPPPGGRALGRVGETLRTLGYGLGPVVLLGVLVVALLRFGPLGVFETAFPPVEELTIERITLPAPNVMRVRW
jgi:hypothetical protein